MKDIQNIKVELLYYGVNLDEDVRILLSNLYGVKFEKGFAKHATHFIIEDLIINTCVDDNFCRKSPYSIEISEYDIMKFVLLKDKKNVCNVDFLKIPDWCNNFISGYVVGDVMRPHSKSCISMIPIEYCEHKKNGGCKFCSFTYKKNSKPIQPKIVAEMAKLAVSENENYEFHISAGVYKNANTTVMYYTDLCKELKKIGCKYISAEVVMPDDLSLLYHLAQAGVNSLLINLEIYNDDLRERICGEKNSMTNDEFIKNLSSVVKYYGKGNVASVLLSGIQSKYDIMQGIKHFASSDIIPIIIPYKNVDAAVNLNAAFSKPNELIELNEVVEDEIKKNRLLITQKGCIGCGGCSLESTIKLK